jgi:cytochrome b561
MTNQWRKNEEMAVWTYDKETAEFREIKRPKNSPLAGFKQMTRVIVWPILIVFYFFIFFLVLSGCAYMKQDDDEIIIEDLEPLPTVIDKVACIKMLESCNV